MNRFHLIVFMVLISGFSLSEELTTEQKAAKVEAIYKKVFAASGSSQAAPKFRFDTQRVRQVAYMVSTNEGPVIAFEEKAFDICMEFGNRADDAIALIIGHEISHHIYKHHWGKEFTSSYALDGLEREITKMDIQSVKMLETQADERGGILCYLAGYDPTGIIDHLLTRLNGSYYHVKTGDLRYNRDSLYLVYGQFGSAPGSVKIKHNGKVYQDGQAFVAVNSDYEVISGNPIILNKSDSYPTLAERIQIAKTQDSIVTNFIRIFEMANYAMLVEKYDVAIECYNNIISHDFHSAEIYNNIGVAYFLKGVKEDGGESVHFIFPVEIDLESKLGSRGQKGLGGDVEILFQKSKEYFLKAIDFRNNYGTAWLNASCAYAVLGDYRRAKFYAEEVEFSEAATSTKENARMALALAHFMDYAKGDKSLTSAIMKELAEKNHILAVANKAIMEGKLLSELEIPALPISWMGSGEEALERQKLAQKFVLDDLSAYTFEALQNEVPNELERSIPVGEERKLIVCNLKSTEALITESDDDAYLIFHATRPGYKSKIADKITLGSTQDEVLAIFGSPNAVITTSQGVMMSYTRNKLLFLFDEYKTIRQMISWRNLD